MENTKIMGYTLEGLRSTHRFIWTQEQKEKLASFISSDADFKLFIQGIDHITESKLAPFQIPDSLLHHLDLSLCTDESLKNNQGEPIRDIVEVKVKRRIVASLSKENNQNLYPLLPPLPPPAAAASRQPPSPMISSSQPPAPMMPSRTAREQKEKQKREQEQTIPEQLSNAPQSTRDTWERQRAVDLRPKMTPHSRYGWNAWPEPSSSSTPSPSPSFRHRPRQVRKLQPPSQAPAISQKQPVSSRPQPPLQEQQQQQYHHNPQNAHNSQDQPQQPPTTITAQPARPTKPNPKPKNIYSNISSNLDLDSFNNINKYREEQEREPILHHPHTPHQPITTTPPPPPSTTLPFLPTTTNKSEGPSRIPNNNNLDPIPSSIGPGPGPGPSNSNNNNNRSTRRESIEEREKEREREEKIADLRRLAGLVMQEHYELEDAEIGFLSFMKASLRK